MHSCFMPVFQHPPERTEHLIGIVAAGLPDPTADVLCVPADGIVDTSLDLPHLACRRDDAAELGHRSSKTSSIDSASTSREKFLVGTFCLESVRPGQMLSE